VPALQKIDLVLDDEPLLHRLVRDFPSSGPSEAAVVEWVEREASADRSRDEGLSPALKELTEAIAEGTHLIHLSGLSLPESLPDTPVTIAPADEARLAVHDVAHLFITAQAGAAYGCVHTQGGRLAHDIFSVPSALDNTRHSQGGFSFHVDGAMDPETAPQYFSMQCLRNSERIPTFAASIVKGDFDSETWDLLTAPVYTIHFDPRAPRSSDLTDARVIDARADGGVNRLRYYDHPERLRVPGGESGKYVQALHKMRHVLNRDAIDVVLSPGEVLLVNNRITVHGSSDGCGDSGSPRSPSTSIVSDGPQDECSRPSAARANASTGCSQDAFHHALLLNRCVTPRRHQHLTVTPPHGHRSLTASCQDDTFCIGYTMYHPSKQLIERPPC
jgi:hypothetical protein